MVIAIQLLLFLIALALRGRMLLGLHLQSKEGTDVISYTGSNKQRITRRQIGIKCEHSIAFSIKKEQWYHRLLKAIGIASEIQITSELFNAQYFITADSPEHLEMAIHNGKLDDHLYALFLLPVTALYATRNRIWCVIDKSDLRSSDVHYQEHVELLKKIAAEISKQSAYSTIIPTSHRALFAFAAISVHAALLTMGILGGIPAYMDSIDMLDQYEWGFKALIIGSTALGAWLLLLLKFFARTSWSCWVIADFVLCGIVGFMLSSALVVRDANIHLSQPEPHYYSQPVLDKRCTLVCKQRCGKRCTRTSSYRYGGDQECAPSTREENRQLKKRVDSICGYGSTHFELSLAIEDWRDGGLYEFDTEGELFDQVTTESRIDVPVHEGALGLKWVDTSEFQKR